MVQSRRTVVVAGLSGAVLAVCGCGPSVERVPVPVVEVRADGPGDTSLEINVGSCNKNPKVTSVSEDDTQILVEIEADQMQGNVDNECLDGVVVELTQPIGDRVVMDSFTEQGIRPEMPIAP